MRTHGLRRLELPLLALAGALQVPAFEHTAAWPLVLLATALLAWRLLHAEPGRAAVLAWAFGFGWLAAGVWWLFISMHRYGGLPAPLAVAAVAALAAALALYLALAGWAFARWRRGGPGDAALFSGLWLLAELARGVLFTGFPWVASGYALVDSPLAALAPWLGVYGLGAVMALAAASAALLVHTRRLATGAGLAVAAGLLGAAALGPGGFTQGTGTLAVTLLQPAVAQDEKFAAERMPQTLAWVARELLRAPPGLVVAPETAIPLLPVQMDEVAPGYLAQLRAHFARGDRAALVGIPLGSFEAGYTNSVVGWSAGPEHRYDKHHLVPFGEFIPTGFRWFTEMMHIPLGDFARGVVDPPPFQALGQRLGPNICYEDLFGEELARRFRDDARAPTVLVNLSNIGWFGRSSAVPQHLHISRLRSLELERPMIRATNTGATVVVDHRARVTATLPPHEAGVLQGQVEGRSGLTPFARWASRFGLWPMLALGLALVLGSAWGAFRRR